MQRLAVVLGSDAKSLGSTCEEICENLSRGVVELAQELGTESKSVLHAAAHKKLAEQTEELAQKDVMLELKITAAAKAMVNILKEVDSRRAEGNHTSSNQDFAEQLMAKVAEAMQGADARGVESKRYKSVMKHIRATKSEEEEDVEFLEGDNTVSLICPLTNAKYTNPVQSKKCKHTYDKGAIHRHIEIGKGKPHCPVAGCSHKVTLCDLVADKDMQRRLRIETHAGASQELQETEDIDDDAPDESYV